MLGGGGGRLRQLERIDQLECDLELGKSLLDLLGLIRTFDEFERGGQPAGSRNHLVTRKQRRQQLGCMADRGKRDFGLSRVIDKERGTGQAQGFGDRPDLQPSNFHACIGNAVLVGVNQQRGVEGQVHLGCAAIDRDTGDLLGHGGAAGVKHQRCLGVQTVALAETFAQVA